MMEIEEGPVDHRPPKTVWKLTSFGYQQQAIRRARRRGANLWWISILWPRVIHLDFGPGQTTKAEPKTSCTAETSQYWHTGESGSWHNLIRAMEGD